MRHLNYFMLVAILSLLFAVNGCGGNGGQVTPVSKTPDSYEVSQLPEENLPENFQYQDLEYKEGSYIVVLKESKDCNVQASADSMAATYGIMPEHIYEDAIQGFSATIPAERLEEVKKDQNVAFVERDYKLVQYAQELPWGINKIDADISTTKAGNGSGSVTGVRIYVLDTGIQIKHPDLRVIKGIDFTGKGTAEDGRGHGTHVAGIAAAMDNQDYVVGVAPGADLCIVKVLDDTGSGYLSWIIKGVDAITQEKKKNPSIPMVANMSLGMRYGTATSSIDIAIKNSIKAGIVYTIAAGNGGENAAYYSPAHVAEAITVGGYDANNNMSTYSNFGSVVDIFAPGENILSTWIGSSTYTASGTSMAAPHVAGACALLLSKNPYLTPSQVRNMIVADAKAWVNVSKPSTTNKSVWVGKY